MASWEGRNLQPAFARHDPCLGRCRARRGIRIGVHLGQVDGGAAAAALQLLAYDQRATGIALNEEDKLPDPVPIIVTVVIFPRLLISPQSFPCSCRLLLAAGILWFLVLPEMAELDSNNLLVWHRC